MSTTVAPTEMPDVQAGGDLREVPLDEVGIAGISVPVTVAAPDGTLEPTVAEAELTVALAAAERGTHMSRFVEELAAVQRITPRAVADLAEAVRDRLRARASTVSLAFPLFVSRAAPVSELAAPHRYDAWIRAHSGSGPGAECSVRIGVRAAVTSLCPCSREISDYGAHSQRGVVEVEVSSPDWLDREGIWPQQLFAYADGAGSARIHPLLKRGDERSVTMEAYDNPAFVEDIAREVVVAVRADPRCAEWSVSVVNQESIHAHQAIARVRGRR